MTFARRASLSDDAFNWPVTLRGLLASFCLVGFSSSPNSSWLIYPAIIVFAYTIYTGAPVHRLISPSDLRRVLYRWCPRLLATALGILVAGLLADGPGVLAAIGSLLFLLILALAGSFVASLLLKAMRLVPGWAGISSAAAGQQLRLQARLIWLSVTG